MDTADYCKCLAKMKFRYSEFILLNLKEKYCHINACTYKQCISTHLSSCHMSLS